MTTVLDHDKKTATITKMRAQIGSPNCLVCDLPLYLGERHFCSEHSDWKIVVPVDPNVERVIGDQLPRASS